jgi:hypothetical protein
MNRILTLIAGSGVVLCAAAAHATTTTTTTATQTLTFGPGLTEFENASQSFALFNSNLGTLQSVTIGSTYGFTSTLTISNTGATGSNGTARTESAAGFGSDSTAINSVIRALLDSNGPTTVGGTSIDAAFDVLGGKSNYTLDPSASTTAASNASTVTIAPLTDSLASDLQAFEAAGGGNSDVLFNTATATTLSNTGGNTNAAEVTQATGTVNLYYTYVQTSAPSGPAPVPEPASIATLGLGLLGAGMVRRWRK